MNNKAAQRWVQIADRDLEVAQLLAAPHTDSAAYHYQQAAEKYLKAFLTAHQVPLKKTHSISTLVVEAARIDVEFLVLPELADLDLMTSFATYYRYPNEEEEDFPTDGELAQAKSFCEKVKELVHSRLSECDSPACVPAHR